MKAKRLALRMVFFLVISLPFLSSCSGSATKDKAVSVEADDPDMVAAIAKARSLLPQFWQVFDHREHDETDFCLKVKITDGDKVEHFWAVDIEHKGEKIFGIINNDPEFVHNVRIGERIPISENDISDWLYMRDGKMVGNYTLRVLFKQMSVSEVNKYKTMLADP